MWKHKERRTHDAYPLPSVVHKISHVSFGDCFAALQIVVVADFSALAPARRIRFPMGREPPQGAVTPALV